MKLIHPSLLALGLLLTFDELSPVHAADRVALVIGNSLYDANRPAAEAPNLANPVRDADAFSKRLQGMGFEVVDLRNATVREMMRGLNQFKDMARSAELGVIYYAGHGIEIAKEGSTPRNHLIPVDAVLEEPGDEQLETLGLQMVLQEMKDAKIRLKVVILDCCRNNPFGSRSWLRGRSGGDGGGLAEVPEKEIPVGTLIVYSGAPGVTVPDGSGGHSPFTGALLEEWQSSRNLYSIMAGVADRVGASEPWIKFDGSGRTFAAFHAYRLDGTGARPDAASGIAPPNQTNSALTPNPLPVAAADVSEVENVEVSSQLEAQSTSTQKNITYSGKKVVDGDSSTAWVEGAEGSGSGEWLRVLFKRHVRLTSVSILSGYGKSRDIYLKNGRPRLITMTTDTNVTFTLRFDDSMKFHHFKLPEPALVRSLRIEIQEVTPGSKYEDTAISEILFE